jgi:hypothetical protein
VCKRVSEHPEKRDEQFKSFRDPVSIKQQGLASITETMPIRKQPGPRQSSRDLKLKEPEVGEGSSPVAAKQLEFSPRPEPIIRTYTKKVFTQPPPLETWRKAQGPRRYSLTGDNSSRRSTRKNSGIYPT